MRAVRVNQFSADEDDGYVCCVVDHALRAENGCSCFARDERVHTCHEQRVLGAGRDRDEDEECSRREVSSCGDKFDERDACDGDSGRKQVNGPFGDVPSERESEGWGERSECGEECAVNAERGHGHAEQGEDGLGSEVLRESRECCEAARDEE